MRNLSRRDLFKGAGALFVGFQLASLPTEAAAQDISFDAGVQIETTPDVDSWIRIAEDGSVTLFTGKVELGTGILTALSQIAAEELNIDFEGLSVVAGDTDIVPNQGGTTATATIGIAAIATRTAAATAFQTLLTLASRKLNVAKESLEGVKGRIQLKGKPDTHITYAELIGGKTFNVQLDAKVKFKDPADYSIVGQPVPRIDIPAKITAAPHSYMEHSRVPGMKLARTLRAPAFGAKLVSYDESVKNMPGVKAVIVLRNPGDERLKRVEGLNAMPGDVIAVVADHEYQAMNAIDTLSGSVKWDAGDTLPTTHEGLYDWMLQNGKPIDLQEDFQESIEAREQQYGKNRASAKQVINATYRGPYLCHGAMSSAWSLADVKDAAATIWTATQGPFTTREMVAQALGFASVDQVHVVGGSSSGMYGRRDGTDQEVDVEAALISQAIGAPVRLQWTRQEDFVWAQYRPPQIVELEGLIGADNRIAGVSAKIHTATRGTYPAIAAKGMEESPYLFDPTPIRGFDAGPLLRTGYMRNVFSGYNVFAMESFVDELAEATKQDPVECRLAYLKDQRAIDVINAATKRAGWQKHVGPSGRGFGVSFALYVRTDLKGPTVTYMCYVAEVDVDKKTGEIRVKKMTCAIDPGLVINPDGVKNQVEGGTIQATSWALHEQVTFDEKIVTSSDWSTYPVLTFPEAPEVDVIVISQPQLPAKGIGEPVTVPVSSAIANALYDATGVRVRTLPLTPENVKAELEKAARP